MFSSQDADAYALSALAVLDADVTSELRQVQCPALVVAGAHDVLLPPEQSLTVHALLRQARFELVEDAAHFVPFQRPQRFHDLVKNFVNDDVLRKRT
jgi:pimeloyl-ACP methyl ester carboxylesterase